MESNLRGFNREKSRAQIKLKYQSVQRGSDFVLSIESEKGGRHYPDIALEVCCAYRKRPAVSPYVSVDRYH